jgi:hypothetical protein
MMIIKDCPLCGQDYMYSATDIIYRDMCQNCYDRRLTSSTEGVIPDGTVVRIVGYGHILFSAKGDEMSGGIFKNLGEDGTFIYYDVSPELVGKEAVVTGHIISGSAVRYSLAGVAKTAWYNSNQLEVVRENHKGSDHLD